MKEIAAAEERAAAAAERFARGEEIDRPPRARPTRWFAIGDPQTTPSRLFAVLERHGLLGGDGWLRPDVGLVSIGDHFDFAGEPALVDRAGREVLAWLASHPREQVEILVGNHDVSRVMELAFETDESFARARELAASVGRDEERARAFHAEFPRIPSAGIALRDYASFSVAQRRLVQRLLLDGRASLATTASLGDVEVLLTHAGVTLREVGLLGLTDGAALTPAVLAERLNQRLSLSLDDVASRWRAGEDAALDLSPAHVTGTTGREGGGLLYHRPARRDRPGSVDRAWEFDPASPRRFEPQRLPVNVAQVAGHSAHRRCVRELTGWVEDRTPEHAALRTLHGGAAPSYVARVEPRRGSLVLIDPGFAESPLEHVELLPIGRA